jgi:hypothetical protein
MAPAPRRKTGGKAVKNSAPFPSGGRRRSGNVAAVAVVVPWLTRAADPYAVPRPALMWAVACGLCPPSPMPMPMRCHCHASWRSLVNYAPPSTFAASPFLEQYRMYHGKCILLCFDSSVVHGLSFTLRLLTGASLWLLMNAVHRCTGEHGHLRVFVRCARCYCYNAMAGLLVVWIRGQRHAAFVQRTVTAIHARSPSFLYYSYDAQNAAWHGQHRASCSAVLTAVLEARFDRGPLLRSCSLTLQ